MENSMDVVPKLRELLIPVLGVETIDDIQPQHALVKDLGADSIDFVEMIYVIEQNFGVVLKTNEIIVGGVNSELLFVDNVLTEDGARSINLHFPGGGNNFHAGMTKIDLFSNLTVQNLADIIQIKMKETGTWYPEKQFSSPVGPATSEVKYAGHFMGTVRV
jgi:acyl carrier protein